MNLSPQQEQGRKAVKDWFLNQTSSTFYLAGYAGTGKTTIAKLLVEEAQKPIFAAYTGRAALQLSQKSGLPAHTLHSLLYKPRTVKGKVEFVFDPESSVLQETDLLLADEVSMLSDVIGQHLLHFPNLRILLIGDPAQLPPPMKSGALIAGRQPDFLLTEIHRQAADNPVLRLATSVREGKGLPTGRYGDSCVMNSRDPIQTAVASKANMILAGQRKTVRKLNIAFRGGDESLPRSGEPVLALQNQHELGVMNGSVWKLDRLLGAEDEGLFDGMDGVNDGTPPSPANALFPYRFNADLSDGEIKLDNLPIDFSTAMGEEYQYTRGITPFDFAYCLTTHKAQGSEWDEVCIINESGVFRDASKQWLYTAITRARKNVLVLNGKVA